MKARFTGTCGRCRTAITVGQLISREFGAPWHTTCVIAYKRTRALAASGERRR